MGRKQKRLLIIAGLGVVLAVALALILMALSNQIVFFYTPAEALAKHVPPGQAMRLGGLVKDGSWKKSGDDNSFVLSDGKGEMTVNFIGILPDLFREGQGIVAEGSMAQDGTFKATNVLAKHDENYIPKEIVDEMKKRGDWKPDDPQAALTGGMQ
ncbi:MAG TPA: cytochrome c maturation protein CcmE [Devosiaceae bacterium]|nr:cytochrome c maturation protein CcmE [Devosiaceae bacterium]